jgi:hypothetical protein
MSKALPRSVVPSMRVTEEDNENYSSRKDFD